MKSYPLPISVFIIASNEAGRITHTLQSVVNWAGEIIVVLNEDVNDGTDKIAATFGAKIFREPWKGFISQKNFAAGKCTQTWLLNLDADETVSQKLRDEIAAVVSQTNPSHAAYEFPRCTSFCGCWIRHGDWYPDRVLRLHRRGAACWVGEEPHARLEVTGTIGRLRADLLHHPAETIDKQIAKISRYSEDFFQDAMARGKTVNSFDLMGRPVWRFLRCYCLRLGFLDGWQGGYIAWMTAFYTITRYAKVRVARDAKKGLKESN